MKVNLRDLEQRMPGNRIDPGERVKWCHIHPHKVDTARQPVVETSMRRVDTD
jgi:hypothetical protein